ncbi:MAG: cache domain-containing protein [Bacteroidales bacterium]|nr:cache domain-containing protein [Bacteroidales bacterium]
MKNFALTVMLISILCVSCNKKNSCDSNLNQINSIAEKINYDLISLREDIVSLSNHIQYKVPFNNTISWESTKKYKYHNNKFLISDFAENQSAIYLPSNKKLDLSLKKIIVNSEILDSVFDNTIRRNAILSQLYFLNTNSFLRIFPFVDIAKHLNSNINLLNLNPYKTINNKPFVDDKAYWMSKPFADPFGRGWIVSCVEPINYRNKFIGILSGDISIDNLQKKYLSSNTEILLLINKDCELITSTKEGTKFLNIPQYREFQYYKPVETDLYLYKTPILLEYKNKNFKNAVKKLIEGETNTDFIFENKKYSIYISHIEEPNWYLLKITN